MAAVFCGCFFGFLVYRHFCGCFFGLLGIVDVSLAFLALLRMFLSLWKCCGSGSAWIRIILGTRIRFKVQCQTRSRFSRYSPGSRSMNLPSAPRYRKEEPKKIPLGRPVSKYGILGFLGSVPDDSLILCAVFCGCFLGFLVYRHFCGCFCGLPGIVEVSLAL
jgi:hypothetical protein